MDEDSPSATEGSRPASPHLRLWRLDRDIIAGVEEAGFHIATADTETWADALVRAWNDADDLRHSLDRVGKKLGAARARHLGQRIHHETIAAAFKGLQAHDAARTANLKRVKAERDELRRERDEARRELAELRPSTDGGATVADG